MDECAASLSTSDPQKRKKEQYSWRNWQKKVGILITYIHMDNICNSGWPIASLQNHAFSFKKNLTYTQKTSIFSLIIPRLLNYHTFSLRKYPMYLNNNHSDFKIRNLTKKSSLSQWKFHIKAKIMHCNFKKSPFNPNVIHWHYENLKINRKLRIFTLRIPQLKQK